MRLSGWWMVSAIALVTGSLAVAQTPAARTISISLSGATEVPGPGDSDGSGRAELTLNPGRGMICYTLNVSGIATATGAHIHRAVAGQAGPILVNLTAPSGGGSKDCVSVDRELLRNMLQNPANYYVNVHNSEFPAGAIRGQYAR